MPLDQRGFEIETKHAVFSLEGLIAWLEKQPPETTYRYTNSSSCLLTQWHRAFGIKRDSNGDYPTGVPYRIGTWGFSVAAGPQSSNDPSIWTYGAALERAKALRDRAQP